MIVSTQRLFPGITNYMRKKIPARRRLRRPKRRSRLPYGSRGVLLSRGERAFYRALFAAVGDQFLIAFKVRAADLLSCSDQAWEQGFGHMVARHHLDFVLCDPESTEILAAVELDDKSHELPKRKRRDDFLNQAFLDAQIPLIRFKAAARYEWWVIAETIRREVGGRRVARNVA